MGSWHGGKGSNRRNENRDLIDQNWEKIFNKKKRESRLGKAWAKLLRVLLGIK